MSATMIEIDASGGRFAGYLARPGVDGTGPGVVVIQEIFGINTEMRRICDGLAKEGFVALCPDLFWRQERGVMLTDHTQAEWDRAFQLYQGFDADQGVEDIAASLTALRAHPATSGKAGVVGFCLGGLLAFLAAAKTDADAAVGYYGVGIQDRLAAADAVESPVMLHLAGQDEYVPADAQTQIVDALGNRSNITLKRYPDQGHAFARVGGANFDAAAAHDADAATLDFFRAHLG